MATPHDQIAIQISPLFLGHACPIHAHPLKSIDLQDAGSQGAPSQFERVHIKETEPRDGGPPVELHGVAGASIIPVVGIWRGAPKQSNPVEATCLRKVCTINVCATARPPVGKSFRRFRSATKS